MAALSSTEPITLRTASCGEASVSYLEAGSGPRPGLVLLHGIGSGARSWRRQLEGLAAERRVIAWNAPGYGTSDDIAPATPDAGDYAERLLQFLDALGLSRVHLVGHSLGALMAARFALLAGARLHSLTLAGTALGHARLPAEERRRLLQGRLDDLKNLGPAAMAVQRGPRLLGPAATEEMKTAVIETMAAIRPSGYERAARMLSNGDLVADIVRIAPELPMQFICGDADRITPPKSNEEAAAARPGAPFHLLPAAGHALYLEQPQAFNALVAAFVEAHDE